MSLRAWSSHQVKPARLHLAGTPCTDFSVRGEMMGLEGKTYLHLLAWASMRVHLGEPVVIQENVEGFSTEELERLLGHVYHVSASVLNPTSYGFPVARSRKWTILRHRWKTSAWTGPWSAFSKLFHADTWFGKYAELMLQDRGIPAWDIYFSGSKEEMFEELSWACNRPDSQARASGGNPFKTLAEFEKACMESPESVKDAFQQALNGMESRFLVDYSSQKPREAYSLNEDPNVTFTSSCQTHLHTLIKNAGLIWPLGFNVCLRQESFSRLKRSPKFGIARLQSGRIRMDVGCWPGRLSWLRAYQSFPLCHLTYQ